MDYRKEFYKKYVSTHTDHRYGSSGSSRTEKDFGAWRKYFGRFLPFDKNASILDCGCGDGSFLSWLKGEGFGNLTGVDVSGEQVQKARSRGFKNIFEENVLDFLKNRENEFDLVFARDLVEHLTKDEVLDFLRSVHRSLRLGGGLVIQTVNGESPFFGRLGYGDFTHETILTRTSLSQALRVAGFGGEPGIFGQEPVVHGLKSFVRFCLWRVIVLILKIYLLADTGSSEGIFSQNIIAFVRK